VSNGRHFGCKFFFILTLLSPTIFIVVRVIKKYIFSLFPTRAAVRKSLEEHEALQALLDDETRALEKTIAVSAADKERLEKEKWQEHVKLQRALNMPEPQAEAMPDAPAAEEVRQSRE
jgi:hypothetical protein